MAIRFGKAPFTFLSLSVLEVGGDNVLVDLVGQRKAPREMPDVVFGIDGFETLVVGEIDLALEAKRVALELHADIFLVEPGISTTIVNASSVA